MRVGALRPGDRLPSVRGLSERKLIWEYPRDAGQGEQMDFAEVMELNDDGLIQRHCVYWGWRGVKVLQDDAYHK